MERWMISELWRELRNVARELGSLLVTLLPWLPPFILAALALDYAGWVAAPIIVLLTPWYRWLLRGGMLPVRRARDIVIWIALATSAAAALRDLIPGIPPVVAGPGLVILALAVGSKTRAA